MLTAMITGIEGQTGSVMCDYLLELGYTVVGIYRRKSVNKDLTNLKKSINNKKLTLYEGDISDATLMFRLIHDYKPHEFYNFAAQSHVGESFKIPEYTFKINAESVITQLEIIKQVSPYTRYYQASTSEMFGGINCPKDGFNELSNFNPRSPYAISKASAFWTVKNYRESYGLHLSNGICFNHSYPGRRGLDFATRKITNGVASIKLGLKQFIEMGDLSAIRDEGSAEDYVKAMHLMLKQEKSDDYIISTGKSASIEQMLKYVCELAELDFKSVYKFDKRFIRPSEVQYLLGDSSKIRKIGWESKYDWMSLLKSMYIEDIRILSGE